MNITLDANPSDAPGCLKLIADDGRDMLVQTDWDWPAIANTFGMALRSIQICPNCKHVSTGLHNIVVRYCRNCRENVGSTCHHDQSDGTVDCKACGLTASQFISAAREYLDNADGDQAADPGYFDND